MAHFCAKRQKGKCLWDGGENYLASPKIARLRSAPLHSQKNGVSVRQWQALPRFAVVAVCGGGGLHEIHNGESATDKKGWDKRMTITQSNFTVLTTSPLSPMTITQSNFTVLTTSPLSPLSDYFQERGKEGSTAAKKARAVV